MAAALLFIILMPSSHGIEHSLVSRSGTLLIVSHCKDGIVIGADSGAFTPELGQVLTEEKVFRAGGKAAVGFIGTTSLMVVGDTDTQKRVVILEEKLLANVRQILNQVPENSTAARVHSTVTAEVQNAIQRFYTRVWKLKRNTEPKHIIGVITAGYDFQAARLYITDFYRPIGNPLAVGRQDAAREFLAGKFVFIPFALKRVCLELLDGSNPALDKSRQLRAVHLYRERKLKNSLDLFTISEATALVKSCLDVTAQQGAMIDAEAAQVRPPNRIASLRRAGGFEWVER